MYTCKIDCITFQVQHLSLINNYTNFEYHVRYCEAIYSLCLYFIIFMFIILIQTSWFVPVSYLFCGSLQLHQFNKSLLGYNDSMMVTTVAQWSEGPLH